MSLGIWSITVLAWPPNFSFRVLVHSSLQAGGNHNHVEIMRNTNLNCQTRPCALSGGCCRKNRRLGVTHQQPRLRLEAGRLEKMAQDVALLLLNPAPPTTKLISVMMPSLQQCVQHSCSLMSQLIALGVCTNKMDLLPTCPGALLCAMTVITSGIVAWQGSNGP